MDFDLNLFKVDKVNSHFSLTPVTNLCPFQCPAVAYYVPDFITEQDEQQILRDLEKVSKIKWTLLSNRRLINFGGVPHPRGMICETIPDWLQQYLDRLNKLEIFANKKANHCLLNEYLPGQGIMPHLDGPLFYPTIATISCASHTVLEFRHPLDDNSAESNRLLCKFLVAPRSLLVLKEEMYEQYLHSIAEATEDTIDDSFVNVDVCSIGTVIPRSKRISLTIRHVPKASKMKIKI
jgi:alkylated DNA repair protein alkB homolog 6